MKLLVVEDDRMFAELVRRALQEEGHVVDVATTGAEGRMLAFVHGYDAIVLDVVLPDANGLQITRELRREGRTIPILVLTGKDSSQDMVRGLDVGADDYLTKPFDVDVLKARVRALVRRGGSRRMERLALGNLAIDGRSQTVSVHGRRIDLTPKEHRLLQHLLLHAEETVTRSELLEKVWDVQFDPGSNVVDVHIGRLRAKLQRSLAEARLMTVRGMGYRLTMSPVDDLPDRGVH